MLDVKFENANILTMDPRRPFASNVGVFDGRIAGLDEQITGMQAERTFDLGGATVLPGFVDPRVDLLAAGAVTGKTVDVAGMSDPFEMLPALRSAVQLHMPGDWLEIVGYEGRFFYRQLTIGDLDRVSSSCPIWMAHRSGERCLLNSAALRLVRDLLPTGSFLEHDDRGELTGWVCGRQAVQVIRAAQAPYLIEALVRDIEFLGRQCLAQGVTSCTESGIPGRSDLTVPVEIEAYHLARRQRRLPVRVQLLAGQVPIDVDIGHVGAGARVQRLRSGTHDEFLSCGPLEVRFTGEEKSHGERDRLKTIVHDAHVDGWQLALHVDGGRATDDALDAVAAAQARVHRPKARHRIEPCEMLRPGQLPRVAALGLIPVFRPGTARRDERPGAGPVERDVPVFFGQSFVYADIEFACSSGRPLVGKAPLEGIQFLVERRSATGRPVALHESVSVDEALHAFTLGAARACLRDHIVGSLTEGKGADMVVLDADPRSIDASKISDVEILATFCAGELRHGSL
ncbi:amidohydrolase [Amycolatopsis japonica]